MTDESLAACNSMCPRCEQPAATLGQKDGSWMRFCETCQQVDGSGPSFERDKPLLAKEWPSLKIVSAS